MSSDDQAPAGGNFARFTVINTHFEAGNTDSAASARLKSAELMASLIGNHDIGLARTS